MVVGRWMMIDDNGMPDGMVTESRKSRDWVGDHELVAAFDRVTGIAYHTNRLLPFKIKLTIAFFSTPSSLPSIGIDTVLASLRERYLASRSYTHLSPQALISVNPYKSTPSDISSFERWKAEWFNFEDDEAGRSGKGGKTRLEPHVFGLAMGVYYHMKRTGQDQSIVTS